MPFFVFTWSVCTLFMRAHRTHTRTQTQTGLSKVVTRAEHCTRQCYYYASGLFYLSSSPIFAFRLFFFRGSACHTGLMLLRAASKPPPPQLPRICMKVLRCLQSLVFYMYLSDVRNGGCKCRWLGLCSVWHSKSSVRKLRDPP